MAGSATPTRLKANGLAFYLFGLLVCLPAAAQVRLTLGQAAQRNAAAQFAPTYGGRKVALRGVVNAPAFHFSGYRLLGIEDGNYGAVLYVPGSDSQLDAFTPGEELEVKGTVEALDGMVVIRPAEITIVGHKPAPHAADVPIEELLGFRYLGRLVRTEIRIVDLGDTAAGAYLVAQAANSYKIFIPRAATQSATLQGFHRGEMVRVVGIAFQFCQRPPYNHNFQLLMNEPATIAPVETTWMPSPAVIAVGVAVVVLVGLFLGNRERRVRAQRETLRKTYKLGEEILGASSAQGILLRIREALPKVLGITRVQLYVFNRGSKSLDAIPGETGDSASISLDTPPGGTQAGAVACYHYRTLLVIPDIERSPFPITATAEDVSPRSLLFVPMLAGGEVIGVLELDQDDRVREFSPSEQELAQHLGNQIGAAIRLLDQRSVQEQLFRTEKAAAVGRLITGVVNELQTPLSSISDLAIRALERSRAGLADRELTAIASEAQKAAAIVARLVSFASTEQVEARPVSVSALLRNLIEFREGDWKASGIRIRDLTSREPLFVLGAQGQIEQVFLNLLLHAEQALARSAQKVITIRTSVLARRVLVEIAFSAPPEVRSPEETAAVLGVTRSVVAGHGGEVRLIEKPNAEPRFEVDLPGTARERTAAAAAPGRPRELAKGMTALLIETDEPAQRQIRDLLAARGVRVVPVNNSDTGLELTHRMRFDLAFCSVHAPGLNWVELSERMQSLVGAFVLLSLGHSPELVADFEGDGRFVLSKPVQEADLDRILSAMDRPLSVVRDDVA